MLMGIMKVSKELGLNPVTVRDWIRKSDIPYIKGFGKNGKIFLTPEGFDKFLKSLERKGK